MTTERYLTMRDLTERYGVCANTIYARMKRDGFPPPIQMGTVRRWVPSEVRAWERRHRKPTDLQERQAS